MFVIPSQHDERQDPHSESNKILGIRSKIHARREKEWSCQGEKEVWSDPSLLLAEFGKRVRWRASCLTNALLANVSRPPTEQHPSVWLWCCLVVVMCAQLHEPTTLSPYSGEAHAILPVLTASWWESAQAFMIMYAFFCCFTQPDASCRFFFSFAWEFGRKADIFCKAATNVLHRLEVRTTDKLWCNMMQTVNCVHKWLLLYLQRLE